jgi:hypothetical protein
MVFISYIYQIKKKDAEKTRVLMVKRPGPKRPGGVKSKHRFKY